MDIARFLLIAVSIFTSVTPAVDGASVNIGDGVVRLRNIRIVSGYTPPVWLRFDGDDAKVYPVTALPFHSVLIAGAVEVLSAAPGGATPTITSVSRDAGSDAGGVVLLIVGTNFESGIVASFGGTNATSTVLDSATQLTVTVPAHTVGIVDVKVTQSGGNDTLTNGFEYLPAPTTTFVSHDFEDETLGSFSAEHPDNVVIQSAGGAFEGTFFARCRNDAPANDFEGMIAFSYAESNGPLSEANGVYQRWYVRIDQDTITAIVVGQVKLLLNRYGSGGSSQGWHQAGVGDDFGSSGGDNEFVVLEDDGNTEFPDPLGSHTGKLLDADVWHEIQAWMKHDGGTDGRIRLWIDGKLYVDRTSDNLGESGSAPSDGPIDWEIGLVFTQTAGTDIQVDIDLPKSANGFIDP